MNLHAKGEVHDRSVFHPKATVQIITEEQTGSNTSPNKMSYPENMICGLLYSCQVF